MGDLSENDQLLRETPRRTASIWISVDVSSRIFTAPSKIEYSRQKSQDMCLQPQNRIVLMF